MTLLVRINAKIILVAKKTSSTNTSPTNGPAGSIQQTSSGLPTGAKAGIGIGVALFSLFLLLCLYLIRRRREKATSRHAPYKEPKANTSELLGVQRYEAGGTPIIRPKEIVEVGEPEASELDGNPLSGPNEQERRLPNTRALLSSAGPVPTWHELSPTEDSTSPRSEVPSASHPTLPSQDSPRPEGPSTSQEQAATSPANPTTGVPIPTAEVPASQVQDTPNPHRTDTELTRLQKEMQELKERKMRLRELEALESRERELQRAIEERQRQSGG
ncbi:hypothetical protein EJ08DRAFT_227494 [Tothia fuscella]|uniref:Uncharacterized protein n=1 Tax=Tothia fuscella TaxID=1048955 RepID=A0A9P4P3L1_9PEZI|nr:hypothetical protein EJ08DRAFT_227494 [Tothia fuscella]